MKIVYTDQIKLYGAYPKFIKLLGSFKIIKLRIKQSVFSLLLKTACNLEILFLVLVRS